MCQPTEGELKDLPKLKSQGYQKNQHVQIQYEDVH